MGPAGQQQLRLEEKERAGKAERHLKALLGNGIEVGRARRSHSRARRAHTRFARALLLPALVLSSRRYPAGDMLTSPGAALGIVR